MKITRVETRPLRIPFKKPYHWAQGISDAAEVILICVHTDEGLIGYGESTSSASAPAVQSFLDQATKLCIGHSPFEVNALLALIYQQLFAARGSFSAPRFAALVLTGLDMALWDLAGKATGLALHDLIGGAVRDHIQYFGFAQGETAEEIAQEARYWAETGSDVIYAKIGHGEAYDLAVAQRVRAVIGERRLRLDANEAWDTLTAQRMIRALSAFNIEFIEQPTQSNSLAALAQVKRGSAIAIAADQVVFTPEDVYAVCREQAADLIVLGLHEAGGVSRFCKAAAIAEAAGLNVCIHGVYETGITTCASNQVGATLTNLDDGNQYMNQFIAYDIIEQPTLKLHRGRLPILPGPGIGFTLDWDAVARAEETYRAFHGFRHGSSDRATG